MKYLIFLLMIIGATSCTSNQRYDAWGFDTLRRSPVSQAMCDLRECKRQWPDYPSDIWTVVKDDKKYVQVYVDFPTGRKWLTYYTMETPFQSDPMFGCEPNLPYLGDTEFDEMPMSTRLDPWKDKHEPKAGDMVLRKLWARRGGPKSVFSDNDERAKKYQ